MGRREFLMCQISGPNDEARRSAGGVMSIAGAESSGTVVIQVDVFTDEPYTGNPAGVCILDQSRDDIWMSRVAREIACPNTAFVQHRPEGNGLDLRWFTAGGIEVDLCGHATLATAHVLYQQKVLSEAGPQAQPAMVSSETSDGIG